MNVKTLTQLLERETKVHEKLFLAKKDEQRFLALADASALLKNTEKISDLVSEVEELEQERSQITKEIASELGHDRESVLLKDLLEWLPPVNCEELERAGMSLKNTVENIKEINQANRLVLKRSSDTIVHEISDFIKMEESGVYKSDGAKEKGGIPRAGLNVRA